MNLVWPSFFVESALIAPKLWGWAPCYDAGHHAGSINLTVANSSKPGCIRNRPQTVNKRDNMRRTANVFLVPTETATTRGETKYIKGHIKRSKKWYDKRHDETHHEIHDETHEETHTHTHTDRNTQPWQEHEEPQKQRHMKTPNEKIHPLSFVLLERSLADKPVLHEKTKQF